MARRDGESAMTATMQGEVALQQQEDFENWTEWFGLRFLYDCTSYLMPPPNASRLRKAGHYIFCITALLVLVLAIHMGIKAAVFGVFSTIVYALQATGLKVCSVVDGWTPYFPTDPCASLCSISNETDRRQRELIDQVNITLPPPETFLRTYEASDGLDVAFVLLTDLRALSKEVVLDMHFNSDLYVGTTKGRQPLEELVALSDDSEPIRAFRDAEMVTRSNYITMHTIVMRKAQMLHADDDARGPTTQYLRNLLFHLFPITYSWTPESQLINHWLHATLSSKDDVAWAEEVGNKAGDYLKDLENLILAAISRFERDKGDWHTECRSYHTKKTIGGGLLHPFSPKTTTWARKSNIPLLCKVNPDKRTQQLQDMLDQIVPFKKLVNNIVAYHKDLYKNIETLGRVLASQVHKAEAPDDSGMAQKQAKLRLYQVYDIMHYQHQGLLQLDEYIQKAEQQRLQLRRWSAGKANDQLPTQTEPSRITLSVH